MEFVSSSSSSSSLLPPPPLSPPSSSSSNSVFSVVVAVIGKLLCGLLTCVFAFVGSLVGAITGALIGQATESGMIRGAAIGAISGAVFSIEVAESSFAMWHSSESAIWSLLYMIDIFSSLLSGRIVREKVGPAVQSAVQSQMSAVDSTFGEFLDIFETGGTKGLSKESVEKIQKITITAKNNMDASGEEICCSVCLQDFQIGEVARCLPQCQHLYHLSCIDGWLIRHGTCPMCRRDL
ncbi:NEP1-interacting protein 1 [Acorus gramineus]|uniref:NEP1-interacting protein 1 n=1 Tax=Acorus gramineus TaxID=55184 RepID=A0AAV9ACA8_ACOGR|nr:NEP1-interacting protein 1 [Acorus gramineus]